MLINLFICYIENDNLNIQLEGMIRVRLIEERSLSNSSRPCSYNCDLKSIGKKFNNTQCAKAIDCRYVSNGFDVCQKVRNILLKI